MDIINYDFIKKEDNKKNIFAPSHPFRMLICGVSGSGKTNVLINLILNYLIYDKIYIYSKHLEQDKYKLLKNFFETIEENEDLGDVMDLPIATFGDSLDEIIDIEDLDEEKKNLIVIDDFITEKNQKKITDLFIRGRHKNSSIIYLTQTYFKVPKDIRLNTNHFLFFSVGNKKEMMEIQKEHAFDVSKDEFMDMFNSALSDDYSFFYIDKTSKIKALKYRMNFDKLLDD